MPRRSMLARDVLRELVASPAKAGRLLVLRDVSSWLRVQFLGTVLMTGIAGHLTTPKTPRELADVAGVTDVELLESLLRLGVSLREIGERGGRYRLRGRRIRALAGGEADDVAGLAEAVVGHEAAVYQNLGRHLAGEPPADYLDGAGDAVARGSRLVEPFLGPFLTGLAREIRPSAVLDVGCGTGVYLERLARAIPSARLIGVDLDPDVVRHAAERIRAARLEDRVGVFEHDVRRLPPELSGPYDLVLLSQNLYYWPPGEWPGVVADLRDLAPGGTVVVTSATPSRDPFSRHLDLVLRVSEGCGRLPSDSELRATFERAGFGQVSVHSLVPGRGVVAAVGRA